jgi:hypothetical protein
MKCPDDYRVIMLEMPGDILACVKFDGNGYPTIYINDLLSLPAKREALRHELRHIQNGDIDNALTIYDAEAQASARVLPDVNACAHRPLTGEDFVHLCMIGQTLYTATFGPTACAEPLPMPSPLYDRQPETWANRKKVW